MARRTPMNDAQDPGGWRGNEGSSGEGTPPTMILHSIPDVLSEGNRAGETVHFVKPTTGICEFPPASQGRTFQLWTETNQMFESVTS